MKKILSFFMTAAAVMAASCDPVTPEAKTVEVKISLEKDNAPFDMADVKVALRETNGSAAYESLTDATGTAVFNVPAGLYEASASYKKIEDGNVFVYNGVNSDVSVVSGGGDNSFSLTLVESKSSQIVIKELYFGGCQKDDGSGAFTNDGYVILYNNSDVEVNASDVCFAYASPFNAHATNKFLANGELSYVSQGWLPAGTSTWWFTRDDIVIAPYSQIVISFFGAIDHTQTYSNSVNLSNADFAMYDPEQYTNAKYVVSENMPSSNYLKTYRYGLGNAWVLSQNSPGFYIYSKSDNDTYSADTSNYDYTDGEKMPCLKVDFDWVTDAVDVFQKDKIAESNKRFPASIDAGYVLFTNNQGYSAYRNVDKEATEAIAENEGKIVYNYAGGTADVEGTTDPSGIDAEASIKAGAKIVYMDSNNSTNDFHQRKYASLTGK